LRVLTVLARDGCVGVCCTCGRGKKWRCGRGGFAKGVTTAQANAGKVRFLGRGVPLHEGDVITTASKSFAILKLADDTRISLRPQTVFAVEAFSVGPSGSCDGSEQGASAGMGRWCTDSTAAILRRAARRYGVYQ
jgi:hypothetical protein